MVLTISFNMYHVADFGARQQFHDPLIPPVTSVFLQCRIFVGDMDFVSTISESQIGASMFCDSYSFDKKHISNRINIVVGVLINNIAGKVFLDFFSF